MNSLEELDNKLAELKKTRDELIESLEKGGLGDAITSGIKGSGSTPQGGINSIFGKADDDAVESEELDDGKKKKEAKEEVKKDEDLTPAQEMNIADVTWSNEKAKVKKPKVEEATKTELIKFDNNGQWDLNKGNNQSGTRSSRFKGNATLDYIEAQKHTGEVKTFDKDSPEVKAANEALKTKAGIDRELTVSGDNKKAYTSGNSIKRQGTKANPYK